MVQTTVLKVDVFCQKCKTKLLKAVSELPEQGNQSDVKMVQTTVLKVDVFCQKCKTKLLKAVSELPGVDKIEIDEQKGTLTVTGEADPYKVTVRARKAGKFAEVLSVGPPPKGKKPNPPEPNMPCPNYCRCCDQIVVVPLDQPSNAPCTIL